MSANESVYTLYEAKARFSELVRRVRAGERVTITYHGQPVAVMAPLAPRTGRPSLEERVAELERTGALSSPDRKPAEVDWSPLARRAGSLDRFLAERE